MQQATAELEQFMAATFNGFRYYDCQFPRCLLWSDSTPRGITNDSRQTWIWFMRLAEGFYLQPVSGTPVMWAMMCSTSTSNPASRASSCQSWRCKSHAGSGVPSTLCRLAWKC